ncbi:MAG: hypothetical protein CLLPBCKN_007288 [Chroococcidiopsis cubana SAG 39.79]|nr:hypothetical protein [Chroococcidiopsis cubana SAG 39.79]
MARKQIPGETLIHLYHFILSMLQIVESNSSR